MQDNISKRIFSNTIYNYIGLIAVSILSFFILIYLTKNLSIEQFGQYNLVLSTQVFFTLFLSLGLPSIILRFVPECIVKNDYVTTKKVIVYGMGIIFLFGIVTIISTHILSQRFPNLIDKLSLAKYLSLASILGLLRAEVNICEVTFCAFLRQGYKIFFEVLGAIIKILLFILSVKLGFGLLGIIFIIGIVDFFLIISYFIRINYYLHGKAISLINILKHRFFAYGVKEYIGKLLSFFWDSRIDAYFITFYLGTASTGIFYFAINIATMLAEYMPGSIMQPISRVVFARQYAKYENQNEMNYLFKLNNKLKAFFVFPIFIVFILLSDKIVISFFDKYMYAIRLFPIILFFMLFYVFLIPVRNIITTLERSEITALSSIVLFYKIPMTIFLTKNFGLIGTACAVGSTFLFYFLIQLFLTKRIIKIEYPWRAFSKILVNSLIAGIIIILLRPFIINVFTLFGVIFFSAVVYLITSYFNKAFDEYDRQIINKPFKKFIWNF